MSLVTIGKNGRVYQRRFDHDEARRLREADPATWSWRALAERFEVSEEAVRRVLDPKVRAKSDRHSRAYAERMRVPCKGGCGRRVWRHGRQGRLRTGYCPSCLYANLVAQDVRPTELRCTGCREWKPDSEFQKASGANHTRRGKRPRCRKCETAARRRLRQRNPEAARAYERDYWPTRVARRHERRSVMAEHVVLQANGDGKTYVEVGRIEAPSADLAIERVAEAEGRYVAVLSTRFEVVPVEPRLAMQVVRDTGGDDG